MLKFSGTHADYGRFLAEHLRANGHDFMTTANMDTLRAQLKIYKQYYPEIIEEVYATAEALHLEPDLLLYEEIASCVDQQRRRANPHQHGCTIFAIKENDRCFVGRNYDWLPTSREFFERYALAISGANRYFAFSDEGVWRHHTGKNTRKPYFEDAVNEHGLYIGLTYAHFDKWNYGLKPAHLIRYVAEKCKTTRQALNAFAKLPAAIPKNYLIADAKGDIATVEHAAKTYSVVRPGENGVLIQTNHALAPDLQRLDKVLRDNPTTTSFLRYAEADHLIARQLPGFQFTDLWRILRDSHYVYNNEVVWSLALELTSGRYNIYYDTATGQKHQKFSF